MNYPGLRNFKEESFLLVLVVEKLYLAMTFWLAESRDGAEHHMARGRTHVCNLFCSLSFYKATSIQSWGSHPVTITNLFPKTPTWMKFPSSQFFTMGIRFSILALGDT